ncbi:hypothetical protein M3Y99_00088900 [Aphelenchoides fujianensis]|nr:hypothetical protein M3Y99_00088900 [Aphelenchoides fujianensis]
MTTSAGHGLLPCHEFTASSLAVYGYTLAYDVRSLPRFGAAWWFTKLVMLTVLNLVLQTFYSAICLVCALFDWNYERKQKKLAKPQRTPSYWRKTKTHDLCDFVYFTSAFPVGIATCALYWILYLANPEFVMPKVTHTAPLVFLLVDTLLTAHHAPSRWTGSATVLALFVFYTGLVLAVKHFQGYWLYPIFEFLSNQQIVLLFTASGILFWFLYLVCDGINSLLWGAAAHKQPTKKDCSMRGTRIIGVAGGTASGKTSVCEKIIEKLNVLQGRRNSERVSKRVLTISQDHTFPL